MAAAVDEAAKEARNAALFGDGPYEAAGRPMFTKLYSYNELLTMERPAGRWKRRMPGAHEDFKKPDNWPDDTEPFKGTWVFWLPEGWAQGVRTQASSGKTLTCYFTPEGKRFWHKKDVEKYVLAHGGKELPKAEPPAPKINEHGEEVKVIRRVTDPDAIPNWPEGKEDEDGFVLPTDWKIGFRQLPGGLHRIMVPPGKDNEGFCYQMENVRQYIAGTNTKLTAFEGSRFQAEVSGEVTSLQDLLQPKGGRRRQADLTLDDFEECDGLEVVALEEENAAAPPGLAPGEVEAVREALRRRGFRKVGLVHVAFRRDHQRHHADTEHASGLFFQTAAQVGDARAYQYIRPCPEAYGGVACGSTYVAMSDTCGPPGRWRIGDLGDGFNGALALCSGKDLSAKWSVRKAMRLS